MILDEISASLDVDNEKKIQDSLNKLIKNKTVIIISHRLKSVEKVDKIVGPGNIYVALAKKAVFGYVSIDSIAGPSEILVLADETANADNYFPPVHKPDYSVHSDFYSLLVCISNTHISIYFFLL